MVIPPSSDHSISMDEIDLESQETVFKDNLPGDDWVRALKARHKDKFTLRAPELLTTPIERH